MKKTIKLLLLCLTAILIPRGGHSAGVGYRLPEMRHLLKALHIQEDSLHDGLNFFSVEDRRVYVAVKNDKIADMGYVVFPAELKAAANTPILNFLERYFLLLDHPQPDHTSQKMLQENRFRFLAGNSATVSHLLPTDEFSYRRNDRLYEATWRRDGSVIFSVSFPAEHQLISGEDKITAEKNFEEDALSASVPTVPEVKESLLTPTIQKDLYILKGGTYLDDKLSSDLFYHRQGGAFRLLSTINHPMESTANMMIGTSYDAPYTLKVTQVLYGFKKKSFDLPLCNWLAFCRNSGCTLYYGVESVGEQYVKATVLAVNDAENYNHLLFVNIPFSAIEQGKGDIEANLETFIPMHNVLNIFAKYHKTRNKEPKMYE